MIVPSRQRAAVEYRTSNGLPVGWMTVPSGISIGAVNVPAKGVTKQVKSPAGCHNCAYGL
jgi:hypothetical protein